VFTLTSDRSSGSTARNASSGSSATRRVEIEQRLGTLLAHGEHDVHAFSDVPERADDAGLEVRHIGGDGEDPLVLGGGHGGCKAAERTLVGDLVGEYADVGGQAGFRERLGAIRDDDRVVADALHHADDARDKRLAINGEQRLVDTHAHRPSTGQNGRGERQRCVNPLRHVSLPFTAASSRTVA